MSVISPELLFLSTNGPQTSRTMNALDKAFIKAFAKNRTPASTDSVVARPHMETLPDPALEESARLVLHDVRERGKRLRVDQPAADTLLVAHMIMPLVEHVQSYEPEQVESQTQPAVLYEERLSWVEPEADDGTETSEATAGQAESNVTQRTDAAPDRDVRTLDSPSLEQQIWDACQPVSMVVAEHADQPELLTVQQSPVVGLAEIPGQDWTMDIEIHWPDIDWDAAQQTAPAQPLAAEPVTEPELAELVRDVAADPTAKALGTTTFAPAWEVDAFRWPQLCQELDAQTQGRLTESGEELFLATREGLRVVALTSTERQEGRSTMALSLARSAARAGARVALVDADPGNPELARRLGMEAPCDWREVMGRNEPLSEAAVASLDDGVTLFPRSYPADTPHGPLDAVLTGTLTLLREHFDLVVVDLPPLDAVEDMSERCVPCPVDMGLVVRNVTVTGPQQSLRTVTALRQWGVMAVGMIENFQRQAVTA